MDGRQYFSGYGGTYQQAPDSSNAAYGRAYGMPGNYFVAGSGAGVVSAIFPVLF